MILYSFPYKLTTACYILHASRAQCFVLVHISMPIAYIDVFTKSASYIIEHY